MGDRAEIVSGTASTDMASKPAGATWHRKRPRYMILGEQLIEVGIRGSGLLTILFVIGIFAILVRDAYPILKSVAVGDLLLGQYWYPISEPAEYGMLPIVYGSIVVTAIAAVIAIPLGIATAVFIGEIAPAKVRDVLKSVIEGLSALPSVVLGFIGALMIAPLIKEAFNLPTGLTAFSGGLVLAFMSLPTIVSITEDALSTVPRQYKEASLALGATHWQTISRVLVPAARSGIVAAIMLGLGRAIGETMAVIMVTGNSASIAFNIFRPARTMTATIAQEMGECVQYSDHYFALFFVGLVLFAITFVINLIADMALRRNRR